MKKKYFITATNTQRGKTFLTAVLALWLKKNHRNVMVMKPIETGIGADESLSDFETIVKFSGIVVEDSLKKYAHPYRFSSACSPHLAAERDGADYPCVEHIKNCAEKLLRCHDVLLIEGAGGLLVPIDRKKKIFGVDVVKKLDSEVILVAQSGLGAINDTCLSIQAMQSRNIKIAGFVLNDHQHTQGEDYIKKDNAKIIEDFTGVKCLGYFDHLSEITREKCLKNLKNMPKLCHLFQDL